MKILILIVRPNQTGFCPKVKCHLIFTYKPVRWDDPFHGKTKQTTLNAEIQSIQTEMFAHSHFLGCRDD